MPRRYLYQGENPQFCNRCHGEFPRGMGPEHLAEEHPDQWLRAWVACPDMRAKYRHLAPVIAVAGETEPIVRGPHDLGWDLEEWAAARREPWRWATRLAQRQVRFDHPALERPFPRSHEGGDESVERMLVHLGYPAGQARGAFVARHPQPELGTSNPSWLNGKPGVALHPDRWDYGTVAHEAAHHMKVWENAEAVNEDTGDEGTHGRQWAWHYARALDRLSKGAGSDFLVYHQRYYEMVQEHLRHLRPGDLDAAEERLEAWPGAQAGTGSLARRHPAGSRRPRRREESGVRRAAQLAG